MLAWGVTPGCLHAELKSFGTLDRTATVPTPNLCPEEVYIVIEAVSQFERTVTYTQDTPQNNNR